MPLIYLEDILEKSGNKYLSVNIAAKRAREINAENSLPMLMANAEKPVTIAIDELSSGRIDYEELDQAEELLEDSPFASVDSEEDEEAEGLEELQSTEEYYEEDEVTDPDETEEGL
ncbi:DNA-directed RNA polymerase subunit omega [Candidatus Poribacteria bacterium]|nr:MAG: DNA-directed RNA polymerase subunit omega [Candidatus Poribacteria bacterium]